MTFPSFSQKISLPIIAAKQNIQNRSVLTMFLFVSSGMVSRTATVLLIGLLGVLFLATKLPPPHGTALPDDPPVTSPRIRLSDGRFLAYKEMGVPKNRSNYRIIIVHGFGSSKEMNFLAPQVLISMPFLSLLFYSYCWISTFLPNWSLCKI